MISILIYIYLLNGDWGGFYCYGIVLVEVDLVGVVLVVVVLVDVVLGEVPVGEVGVAVVRVGLHCCVHVIITLIQLLMQPAFELHCCTHAFNSLMQLLMHPVLDWSAFRKNEIIEKFLELILSGD